MFMSHISAASYFLHSSKMHKYLLECVIILGCLHLSCCSTGDRSQFYQTCLARCVKTNCSASKGWYNVHVLFRFFIYTGIDMGKIMFHPRPYILGRPVQGSQQISLHQRPEAFHKSYSNSVKLAYFCIASLENCISKS